MTVEVHIDFKGQTRLYGRLPAGENGSYTALADAIRQFGADSPGDLAELWHRLVFSLLASIYDDHLRNHGFIMREAGRWSLSPAYDLNPVPKIDRAATKGLRKNKFRVLPCSFAGRLRGSFLPDSLNMLVTRASPAAKIPAAFHGINFCADPNKTAIAEDQAEPSRRGALFVAGRFGLAPAPAMDILREVFVAVTNWRKTGGLLRLKAATLDAFATAFENPMMAETKRIIGR